MKTPIKPEDVREGDLIRWESPNGEDAHELRIDNLPHTRFATGQHYLLDRPAPRVELPTEPTLGWARWDFGDSGGVQMLAVWELRGSADSSDGDLRQVDSLGNSSGGDPSEIAEFTPATAVATEALDELRRQDSAYYMSGIDVVTERDALRRMISTFLAAVDEANS